jgi:hypothetical protein
MLTNRKAWLPAAAIAALLPGAGALAGDGPVRPTAAQMDRITAGLYVISVFFAEAASLGLGPNALALTLVGGDADARVDDATRTGTGVALAYAVCTGPCAVPDPFTGQPYLVPKAETAILTDGQPIVPEVTGGGDVIIPPSQSFPGVRVKYSYIAGAYR